MKIKIFIFLIFIIFTIFNSSSEIVLKKVSFIPHWQPQCQFAGYYMAYEKGIYKKHGLDVTIITGGARNPASKVFKNYEADFATLWLTNALRLYNDNFKVVNLAQYINKSSLMLVAKKSSGIYMPYQMQGKKIGIWGGDYEIQPTEFFKKFNLKVRTIQQNNSINLFLMGGVQVSSVMWYNEYYSVLSAGINPDEINEFWFADYGLNFPEDGIYCRADVLENDPQMCKAFVEASLEGWKYAFEHQDETILTVIQYAKKHKFATNYSHQKWMLNRMKDMLTEGGDTIRTTLLENDFKFVGNVLVDEGLIRQENIPEFKSFFKPYYNIQGR